MISASSRFEEENMFVDFTGECIDNKLITIPINNDVDFKDLVDYLVKIIPKQTKISSTFQAVPEGDNSEKLELIKVTTDEIFEKFNSSIDLLLEGEEVEEEMVEEAEQQDENSDEDLPF